MTESEGVILALAFHGLLLLSLIGYIVWNGTKKEWPMRMATLAKESIGNDQEKAREFSRDVCPGLISASASAAGITIASLFIVIGIIVFRINEFITIKQLVMYVIFGLTAIASICWLFSVELLSQMLPGLVKPQKMLAFYSRSMDLWIIGLVLIVIAIILFLLLVHPILSMVTGFFASAIAVMYWKMNNDW